MGGVLTRSGNNEEQQISCPCCESNPNFLEIARSLAITLTDSVRLHKYEGFMYSFLYYVWVLIQLQTEYETIGPICACYEDILKLGTRWRREAGFMFRPLYTGRNKSKYSMNERLGGNQSRSGCSKEDENSSFLLEVKKSSAVQPVDKSLYLNSYSSS
jgi:hypothetical protein